MRKFLLSLMLAGIMLCAVSCGSAKEEEKLQDSILALEQEKTTLTGNMEALNEDKSKLQAEVDILESELLALQEDYDEISKEYDDYKEEMKPFAALSVAEAEAQLAKIEKEKKAEEAEKKRVEKEKAEKAAAEKAKGYETGITFDQLARTPDKYEGKKIKFKGKVIQVLEDESSVNIRVAVDSDYDQVLLGMYLPEIVSSRVLDNDIITIYGTSEGLYTYESTGGSNVTIPFVLIEKIDQ